MLNPTAVHSPAHEWCAPLTSIRPDACGSHWALLYSGMASQGSGRYSMLASHPLHHTQSGGFAALHDMISKSTGRIFGYLGYGLRHETESLIADEPSFITLDDIHWFAPSRLSLWDHQEQNLKAQHDLIATPDEAVTIPPQIARLSSNMTKADYLDIVARTIEQIHDGKFYQANITRKFFGEFTSTPHPFALFRRLCAISPAPFSAFLQLGDASILSSSPEGFLSIDAGGKITARPIKGSAPRGANEEEDAKILQSLLMSRKDRAENLMIVDLMRNDLSRSCTPGSVHVSALFDIHSYATIHQMISTVTGQRRHDCSTLDVIRGCFPPGSMTGAPKINAMNWCAQHEKHARGIYSGAIGWIGADGSCDLSVVIRTLILKGNRFEFQVGGGIVADSTPQAEWEETMTKARGIIRTLGIDESALRDL